MFKVIISGGGTGGHVFPAIAIANALKQKIEKIDILFVGAKGKMEMEKVPREGYAIKGLWISGIRRKFIDFSNLLFPFKLLISLIHAFWIIKKFKPNVVVGTGGYASGPLLFVGSKLGIPSLIQEQNSYPGITNKLLSKMAQFICVAYDNMEQFFPAEKLVLLGNPVRQDLENITEDKYTSSKYFNIDSRKNTILFLGGSLGALTINQSVQQCLKTLENEDTQVIWQTGNSYLLEAEKSLNIYKNVKVMPFIDRIDLAYLAADVIVSRAGASTISELCLIGKPVILIPSPNVAEDHQTKNALALVEKKAALMISDSNAIETMPKILKKLLLDVEMQNELRDNIKKLAKYKSADNIADQVIKLAIR